MTSPAHTVASADRPILALPPLGSVVNERGWQTTVSGWHRAGYHLVQAELALLPETRLSHLCLPLLALAESPRWGRSACWRRGGVTSWTGAARIADSALGKLRRRMRGRRQISWLWAAAGWRRVLAGWRAAGGELGLEAVEDDLEARTRSCARVRAA